MEAIKDFAVKHKRGIAIVIAIVVMVKLLPLVAYLHDYQTRQYSQEIQFSENEVAHLSVTAHMRYNCPLGDHCSDPYMTRGWEISVKSKLLQQEFNWKGDGYAYRPVFLGGINGRVYLVLFSQNCNASDGGRISVHPVYLWDRGNWMRVPRIDIPVNTKANLLDVHPQDGKEFTVNAVSQYRTRYSNDPYRRAWYEMDFDAWHKLIWGQCGGVADRD